MFSFPTTVRPFLTIRKTQQTDHHPYQTTEPAYQHDRQR